MIDASARIASVDPAAVADHPLIVIRPSRAWVPLNLGEIWSYRELLYFLTWRDVKVRYKQAALGVAWAVIQPLFTMLIFTLFFGRLAKIPSNGVPYPLFSYAALLPWTFFANALASSGNSLVGNRNLITKVYFPRLIVPAAAVAAGLVDFAISFVVFIGLFAYYRFPLTSNILMVVPLVALVSVLAIGVGMWMSAVNVRYRDVQYALPFLIQLWMFVSPVIYPSSLMPQRWRWLLALNPMTGIIEGFRSTLLGQPFVWNAIAYSVVFTLTILIYASFSFRRMERYFADIV
jgi:homopolymeric O-antigen transport system permease protein